MTSSPLGLRLSEIEDVQRENPGSLLELYDLGTLAAARRSGDPEMVARVKRLERIEAARAAKLERKTR